MNDAAGFFAQKKNELGVSLNEIQRKAVLQTEGPLLLLASPGSGKTTTIIMRIGYLIEVKGIHPYRIKAVTFSRDSADDMKKRFKRFFPDRIPVDFSTIHSMAFEVVRDHFKKKGIPYEMIEGNQMDEAEYDPQSNRAPLQKGVILRKLFKAANEENITEDQFEALVTYISFIKNKLIPAANWQGIDCIAPKAVQILEEYERFKQFGHSKRLLDYDDMLTIAEQALESDGELLRKYQRRYDYVLTDESQDTSLVQHAIVEKLVKAHRNLCVVADDDQSIYSWRGAEPDYLLNFKEVYPEAVTLFMEQNYRSTPDIVDVSNAFIKRNKKRYKKNMFTENAPLKPIELIQFQEHHQQPDHLVKCIKGVENLAEVAVLYRNNSSSVPLLDAFDRAGIPFYMKDADNRFFSHWVVEDVLNIMRFSFNDKRFDLFEKIYRKVNGYISRQQVEALKRIQNNESVFDNLFNHVPHQEYQSKQLLACKETILQLKNMAPKHAIYSIRDQLGYDKALEKICDNLGYRKDYLFGILNTLEEIAEGHTTLIDFANRLKHLETLLKAAKENKGKNAVTFSTFHSSKGLEFERVFMIDLVEGVIPSKDDSASEALMEEATRLFYVGMTRAKFQLTLISYLARDGRKTEESSLMRAVRDIISPPKAKTQTYPDKRQSSYASSLRNFDSGRRTEGRAMPNKDVLVPYNPNAIQHKHELAVGLNIKHRVFGSGTIVSLDNQRIFAKFGANEKVLMIVKCLEMGLLERL